MRYALFLVVITLLAALAGCTSVESDNSQAMVISTPEPAKTVKGQSDGPTAAECQICNFDHVGYKGELKKVEIDGLLLALNDEYLSTATYERVNKEFGDPRPFVNIVEAEKRHAERLKGLFTKYGIQIPENPWPGKVPTYKTVADACKAGVDAEIANRDLYTRLFKSTERQDILDTYRALQRASEENHLPAFERCGSGGGGRGPGNGRGPQGDR